MARARVYVTRHLPGGALDTLRQHTDVRVWEGDRPPPPEELRQRAAESNALLCLLTDTIDLPLLEAAPGLIVVSNMATGFDNIDVDAASERLVLVTRTPDVLAETTADFAFALLLAAARRVVEGDRHTRAGKWRTWGPEVMLGQDVHGATIGIIGMGGIGQEIARRAKGFRMRILYNSRTARPDLELKYDMTFAGFDDLLRRCDFVTLHAPLTPETHHLIGARELALMKPSAVLINTARGPLVDEAALCDALRSNAIFAAALDVTDPEPMAPDNPLLTLENAIVTPHIASASVATRSRMAMLAVENLLTALRGDVPKDAVNRQVARQWRKRIRERQFDLS